MSTAASGGGRWRDRWIAFGVLVGLHGVVNIATQGLGFLVPLFTVDLALSHAQVGLLIAAVSCGAAVTSLLGGWIGDRTGGSRVLLLGPALVGGSLMAAAFAPGYWPVVGFLALSGAGVGVTLPTINRAVSFLFPPKLLSTAMGLKQTSTPLVPAIATFSLAPVSLLAGWRVVLLGVGVSIVVLSLLGAGRGAGRGLGLAQSTVANVPSGRRRRSILPLHLWAFGLAALLNGAVQLAFVSYLVLYLREELLLPALVAADYLGLVQLMAAVGRSLFGWLGDRPLPGGRFGVLRMLCATCSLAAVTLGLLPRGTPQGILTAVLVLLALASYGWSGVFLATVVDRTGPRAAAQSTGFVSGLTFVGQLAGPPLFGLVVDLSHEYLWAWVTLGVVSLGSLCLVQVAATQGAAAQRGRPAGGESPP